jgi:hypothetical protein
VVVDCTASSEAAVHSHEYYKRKRPGFGLQWLLSEIEAEPWMEEQIVNGQPTAVNEDAGVDYQAEAMLWLDAGEVGQKWSNQNQIVS